MSCGTAIAWGLHTQSGKVHRPRNDVRPFPVVFSVEEECRPNLDDVSAVSIHGFPRHPVDPGFQVGDGRVERLNRQQQCTCHNEPTWGDHGPHDSWRLGPSDCSERA